MRERKHKDLGWIRLWREEQSSLIWKNPTTLRVWLWCRLKASHRKRELKLQYGKGKVREIELQPGQFVFGKYSAASDLSMAPSTFYDQMRKLQALGELDLKPDRFYTLATIVNWGVYEGKETWPDREAVDELSPVQPTAKSKKSDRKNAKSQPQQDGKKSGDTESLRRIERNNQPPGQKSPTAKSKKSDTNNNEINKTEPHNNDEEKITPSGYAASACGSGNGVAAGRQKIGRKGKGDSNPSNSSSLSSPATSKPRASQPPRRPSRGEPRPGFTYLDAERHNVRTFLKNLRIATEAVKRNRKRRGEEGGPSHVEIARRLFAPAEKAKSYAEEGLLDMEESFRRERHGKMLKMEEAK